MEICRLPVSATQRGKLISAGYTSLSSLSSVSASDLARDLQTSESEASEILKAASQSGRLDKTDGSHAIIAGAQTAWDMLHEEDLSRRITTSCADLDKILGGGIACKEVTEIGGVPGIGKTQLGIQLAVNIQIPVDFGGLGGKAIYIGKSHDVINGILVKVVIIDSVTFHFRQDFEDMALRTRLLSGMALKLMKLANKYSLAVVLLNQVTTKYSDGSFHLTLALGDSWSHACTNRVILYWNGNERYAYIDKSPSLRSASAPYSVTGKGIRDSASNCKRIKIM
ncbi:hypothetical protein RHSIM_Rhsim07G0028900 [Rhododendron simsii]|uniref:DNA repair protein RAD51 homolog 3 n=1 Tax=Rhododendron simsii TaxID=118357 RepID=A0A834GUK7_RHOSS|nr:hypothetical protein RHSIM_Rhsim07G0028900 [Rhododendron simsii]